MHNGRRRSAEQTPRVFRSLAGRLDPRVVQPLGLEAGHEDIFPDAVAVEFARQFAASPKESERQMAATISAAAFDSAE